MAGGTALLTRAVGALLRALASSLRARSYSLFSDSSFTAASQISSLLGLACGASTQHQQRAGRGYPNQRQPAGEPDRASLCSRTSNPGMSWANGERSRVQPQDTDFLTNRPACLTATDVQPPWHWGHGANRHPLPADAALRQQPCSFPSLAMRNWPSQCVNVDRTEGCPGHHGWRGEGSRGQDWVTYNPESSRHVGGALQPPESTASCWPHSA